LMNVFALFGFASIEQIEEGKKENAKYTTDRKIEVSSKESSWCLNAV